MAAKSCFAYVLLIDSSVKNPTLFRGDHTPMAFEIYTANINNNVPYNYGPNLC